MNRFSVWNSVQCSNKEAARYRQAGVVYALNQDNPDHVAVRWDSDGQIELVANDDLKAL